MADILKPKQLAGILKSIPEDKLDDAAAELGVDATKLNAFIKKPSGKFLQTVADKLGEGVEGAQKFVDKFVGRTPTELEQVGMEAAKGGVKPPSVQPQFAAEQIKPPGETGFQMPGPTGGPLATIEQPGQMTPVPSPRLSGLGQKLEERTPLQLGPAGRREETLRSSLSDEFDARMGFDEVTGAPKSVVPKKAAGLGAAAAAAGAAGLASVGFSKEANAPVVIKEAAVDKPDDVAPLLEKAKKNVEPGKQAALVQQAQQVTQVAKSIEELFKEVRDENRDKQARIELMKVTETIMHGLVTAIGANALLNRNSPFAVDFSQGPKTDWNAQFDRLQKQFDTQIGFLTEKYKIEEAGKRAVARETQRQAERKEDLAFKEKELAAKQQGQATSAAEAQEKKKETAIASATGIIEKISALDKEKDSQQLATARGQLYKQAKAILPKEELVQVEERAAALFNAEKSKWKEFFRSVGLASQEPSKKEYGQMTDAFARALNEKINPAPGFAGQTAPASATVGGKTYSKPAGMSDADWAEYIREVGGQ